MERISGWGGCGAWASLDDLVSCVQVLNALAFGGTISAVACPARNMGCNRCSGVVDRWLVVEDNSVYY